MKHLKTLGLAAVAAMALMAFFGASSAPAAVLCKINTDPCTSDMVVGDTLTLSLTSGKEAVLKAAFSQVNCKSSHVAGKITNTGGAGKEVEGELTQLTFTECTCGARPAHVTSLILGALKINDAGTVFNTTTKLTYNCTGLARCVFGTVAGGTDIGRITEGTPGELDGEATLTWYAGTEDDSQFVCAGFGNSGTWTASYQVTTPTSLFVSNS